MLAERLDVERTSMGKMVGTLERDGFVAMRPSPTDGRYRVIELTREGNALHGKATSLWNAAQQEFAKLNGARSVDTLRKELDSIVVERPGD